MMGKADLVQDFADFLRGEDFSVSTTDSHSSCFDVLARRNAFIVLLKLMLNIDGFRKDQADDMANVSNVFSAYPLIIGEKTRNFPLNDGVLYNRHGINAVSRETFEEIVLHGGLPVVSSSRGGYCVRIDGEKLKTYRKLLNISLGEVAEKVGVTRSMIYLYENSGFGASLDTAMMLEEFLDETLILPLEVFSVPSDRKGLFSLDETERNIYTRLEEMGFGIRPVKRAPFEAVIHDSEERMLTKLDRAPRATHKTIRVLKEVSDIASYSAFVISSSPRADENMGGIPIIKNSELERIGTREEFIETMDCRR